MAAAAGESPFVLGVGEPKLEDVLAVVCGRRPVAIDAATSSRIKKDSPPPKQFKAEEAPASRAQGGGSRSVDPIAIRAALFFKLNNLVNGKSKCRLAVLEQICGMLNAGVYPAIVVSDGDEGKTGAATDTSALSVLADAFHGVGVVSSTGGSLQAALEGAGIAISSLSAEERMIFEDGIAVSSGVGAVVAEEGKASVLMATCVAALSAEALKAEVKIFEADIAETFPLKESNAVSETMRTMFAGSTQAVVKKNNAVVPAIVDVPAVHGGMTRALNAVAVTSKASLSAQAMPPHKSGRNRHYLSASSAQELLSLGWLLATATRMSLERFDLVVRSVLDAEDELKSQVKDLVELRNAMGTVVNDTASVLQKLADTVYSSLSDGVVPSFTDACLNCMGMLNRMLSLEAAAALLAVWVSKRNFVAANGATEANGAPGSEKNSKKKMPTYSLGAGSAATVDTLLALLQGTTSDEEALASMSLNDASVPAGLGDIRAAVSVLEEKLNPRHAGFKGIMDTINRVLEANAARRLTPKIAKGARDFGPEQMAIREVAFKKITDVFKRHGAVSIDTPVFELRDTLMGKYGEDSKLIYDLADQGGELLSLRYDLTVPFARHVAVHGISNIKRYHIAKVYRRDQPQMNRGRFREFFQCDFDIAGVYSPMVPDAEVLKVLVEILDDLALGDYEVKINHRKILDAMLDIAGVPASKFRPICSAIDKLDKEPWEVVKKEMVEQKGLAEHVADKIGEFVVLRGDPRDVLTKLQDAAHPLSVHPESAKALEDMKLLFDFLDVMGALKPFSFDLSLARGLDYYTGVIYEAVFKGGSVGSIAAGGRYDHLVGMFSNKEVPAVGVSIGIERVFAIIEAQMQEKVKENSGTIRETETEVLVASIGNGLQAQRMGIAADLWRADIKCEFGFKPNPKMADQLGYALKSGIPLMVIFGEDEIIAGKLKLKDLDAETEIDLDKSDLVAAIKEKLAVMGDRRIVFAKNGGA